MTIELTATFAGLLFGSVGTLLTVRNHVRQVNRDWREKWEAEIHRKAQAEVKEYAAQRDFAHLQKNYEQQKKAIEMLQEETDEQGRTLVEVQTTMKGMFHQVNAIAAKLDASTGGWTRQQQRD
ncbi:MAG: hypothetical protein HC895_27385 [Leptolyngbyaceae cyanobacterium SM1_3_5]|nr:hypothetical protein [Leptolyngbyaceae cyanobacterium SM1_3_5]